MFLSSKRDHLLAIGLCLLFVLSATARNQNTATPNPKKKLEIEKGSGRCAFLLSGPAKVDALKPYQPATSTKVNEVKPPLQPAQNVKSQEVLTFLDTKTAWNLSLEGIRNLTHGLYRMENAMIYLGSGILAKENVLADGPGGGGKTFSVTAFLRAQVAGMMESIGMLNENQLAGKIPKRSASDKITQEQLLAQFSKDIHVFIEGLKAVIAEDKAKSPNQHLFTLQLHEAISEIPILGGINPFEMVKTGKKKLNYSNALIAAKNFFGILDEIDKAPVAVQMTLLAILNERESLNGNEVIKTMLESVVATTNASLGELISQAKTYEIGGRQALIDRLLFKIHFVNVLASEQDDYFFLQQIKSAKATGATALLDLRSLRPLVDQVRIPKDLMEKAAEIADHMDLQYTSKYNEKLADSPTSHPRFYPSFSGSGRTLSKLVNGWVAAFLMRQLVEGVPFDSLNLQMAAKDLIDLGPVMLQGGPEMIVPGKGAEVVFNLFQGISNISNRPKPAVDADADGDGNTVTKKTIDHSSVGHYDPFTQTFTFSHPFNRQTIRVHFDVATRTFVNVEKWRLNPFILLPETDANGASKYLSLEAQLYAKHLELTADKEIEKTAFTYEFGGYIKELINGAPLRRQSKAQLDEILDFHTKFITQVNSSITELRGKQLSNYQTLPQFLAEEEKFKSEAAAVTAALELALNSGDQAAIMKASAAAVQQFYAEANHKFLNADAPIQALMRTLFFSGNAQMYGPPGSAKTLIGRSMLKAALKSYSQAEKIKVIKSLAGALSDAEIAEKVPKRKIFVKQFHPMSSESDIVGFLDLSALKENDKFQFSRDNSLSEDNIVYALLDEWEKSPPGVRTAALSVLNERAVMMGDELYNLTIDAIFLATNSTPGEFLISQGRFSTGFPIHDRIQQKIYFFNKFSAEDVLKFFERAYFQVPLELHAALPVRNLRPLIKNFVIPDELLNSVVTAVHHQFFVEMVEKSEAERELHESDPTSVPDFYINSRGESMRSLLSAIEREIPAAVILDRILRNEGVDQMITTLNPPINPRTNKPKKEHAEIQMVVRDLVSMANVYLTANFAYQVGFSYPTNGFINFEVIAKDISHLNGHINSREQALMTRLKEEADTMVAIMNTKVSEYLKSHAHLLAKYPEMFPTMFATPSERKAYLRQMGYSDQENQ